jgi:hypothetical protein
MRSVTNLLVQNLKIHYSSIRAVLNFFCKKAYFIRSFSHTFYVTKVPHCCTTEVSQFSMSKVLNLCHTSLHFLHSEKYMTKSENFTTNERNFTQHKCVFGNKNSLIDLFFEGLDLFVDLLVI